MNKNLYKILSICFVFLVTFSLSGLKKAETIGPSFANLNVTPSSVMPDSTVEFDILVNVTGICNPSFTINKSVTTPLFTDFSCGEAPTDWTLDSASSTQCQYSSAILPTLSSGTHFVFSAHSPVADNSTYDFEINNGCMIPSSTFSVNLDNTILTINPISIDPITGSEATIFFDTNTNSTCRYSNTTSVYADMTNMETTGTTSHSHHLTGLSGTTDYMYNVRCQDGTGNTSVNSEVSFTTLDGTAPVISNSIISSITKTSATISLNTDEDATCRFNSTNVAYDDMADMGTTGNTSHSQNLSALSPGSSYSYYFKCIDGLDNISESTVISFRTIKNPSIGSFISSFSSTTKGNSNVLSVVNPSFVGGNEVRSVKNIKENLFLRKNSEDVKILQEFLIKENKGVSALSLAKNGTTNYFGKLTKAALIEWQKAVGLQADGILGPKTKAKMIGI